MGLLERQVTIGGFQFGKLVCFPREKKARYFNRASWGIEED